MKSDVRLAKLTSVDLQIVVVGLFRPNKLLLVLRFTSIFQSSDDPETG